MQLVADKRNNKKVPRSRVSQSDVQKTILESICVPEAKTMGTPALKISSPHSNLNE